MTLFLIVRYAVEVEWRRLVRLQDAAVVHFGRDLQQGSRPAGGHFWLNDRLAIQHRPPRRQLAARHVHQQRLHLLAHFLGHRAHADPLFRGHARPGESSEYIVSLALPLISTKLLNHEISFKNNNYYVNLCTIGYNFC